MRLSTTLSIVAALPCVLAANYTKSSKRGLIYVPSSDHPSDAGIWTEPNSDLTWYYNYALDPSPPFASDPSFAFVPMLWGAPASTSDTTFLDGVTSMINAGKNITYVLSFNEPDGSTDTGGSNVSPDLAAQTWIREIEPLRKLGVKCGAPAVTGATTGFTWLQDFFAACDGACTADFLPVHWYGDFAGMASNIGQKRAA